MKRPEKADAGNRPLEITRRGWWGALAGVAAAVASLRRGRQTVAEKRRRRRFWIGHT